MEVKRIEVPSAIYVESARYSLPLCCIGSPEQIVRELSQAFADPPESLHDAIDCFLDLLREGGKTIRIPGRDSAESHRAAAFLLALVGLGIAKPMPSPFS